VVVDCPLDRSEVLGGHCAIASPGNHLSPNFFDAESTEVHGAEGVAAEHVPLERGRLNRRRSVRRRRISGSVEERLWAPRRDLHPGQAVEDQDDEGSERSIDDAWHEELLGWAEGADEDEDDWREAHHRQGVTAGCS